MTWENYEHEDVFAAEREAYPREQYEADRAKLIAEGIDPRLIMSYTGTLSLMAWEAEMEREAEIWESYDEAWDEEDERQMREAYAELEREKAAEREVAADIAERDEIAELAEMAEESALAEVAAFGSCQGWFFGSAEAPVVWETGFELWEEERFEPLDDEWNVTEEWLAWEAASEDIPGFYELNLSL